MNMKRIPLKRVDLRLPGQAPDTPPVQFRYSDAIFGILNATAADRGIPLSEINKALRIINPIEAALQSESDFVLLEDADWQHLKQAVETYRGWRIIHRAIEDFAQDITKAVDADEAASSP